MVARSLLHLRAIAIFTMVALVVAPGVAEAHTEFDHSVPADGASVGVPVDEITVAFTSPVSLVGNGFAVLDPQNDELAPRAVTDDDTVYRLQFDPPLAGGTVAVRYEVRADDGHVLSGSFVFDIEAPAPTTTPSTTVAGTSTTTATTSASSSANTTGAPRTDTPTTIEIATAPPPVLSVETPASDDTSDEQTDEPIGAGSDDDGSGIGLVLAVAAAVAVAVGGLLVLRSRTST